MSELQRMLGLLPPSVAPTDATPAWTPASPPNRVQGPWEPLGFVAEADDGDLDDDEAGIYDDDEGYDEDDGFDGAADPGSAWQNRSTARHPARSRGGPPLGSYESRQAALRGPRRRRPFRVILPVLALVAVGAGAVRLLPRPDTQLAIRGAAHSPTVSASTAPSTAPSANSAGTTALTSFAAYPGQQSRDGGQLAVNSVAAANGVQLAVGSADGHPAIWRQRSVSSWSLADSAVNAPLASLPGNQTLIAVTEGPSGWLAVGDVVSGARQHPVVVTSANGQIWRAAGGSPAFSGTGLYAYGAAAGRIDYVIVGEQATGKTATATTWWSAGLGNWNRGVTGVPDGNGKPSGMFAVTVGPERFIAVGAYGSQPAVWTSPNGQQWMAAALPLPARAAKAALRQVVSSGQRVVATGNAETPAGPVAFAEVSGDGGRTWREVPLPPPGTEATVSALAASSSEFVAAGQSAQPGGISAVVWTSPDGMSWVSARAIPGPPGSKVQGITSLASAGGRVTGIGVATSKTNASAVLYTVPGP